MVAFIKPYFCPLGCASTEGMKVYAYQTGRMESTHVARLPGIWFLSIPFLFSIEQPQFLMFVDTTANSNSQQQFFILVWPVLYDNLKFQW